MAQEVQLSGADRVVRLAGLMPVGTPLMIT